ncbi:MAG: A24 family peptidase [Thermoanaerobaculales bacterium]|jgi:leader peptidase (prepilin peptidase)/N-methyltransferase|nr:A24 family peptidase [Thermoanaerobaculales bacterium]
MPGQTQTIVILYAFVVGAVVGSFLNVVIHRVPRRLSIVSPRSACPTCATPIAWYDNLPIVSWIILGARCRSCRARIAIRYPLVEAAAAGLAVLGVVRYGLGAVTAEVVIFAWLSLALALIDLEHQLLPDVMTYPAIVLGLGFSWFGGLTGLGDSLAGAVVGAALPTTVILLYRWLRGVEGMGWGDVKYLAAIGSVVGLEGCLMVLVTAAVLGALVGGALIVSGRGTRSTALPFGTFLAAAVLLWLYLPEAWRSLSLL